MVSRFIKVQDHMQAKLGKRMDELKATYDKLDKTPGCPEEAQGLVHRSDGSAGQSGLAASWMPRRRRSRDSTQADFSVGELQEWVRTQVYAAVGMATGGFDVKKLAEQAKAGNVHKFSPGEKDSLPDVPDKNKELVAPYEKQLKELAPFAFFGF